MQLELFTSTAIFPCNRIQTPLEAVHLLKPLALECQEVLAACFLTSQNGVIATREIFRGTIRTIHASPREILKLALQLNAGSILIAHNHPSNDVTPSRDDLKFTSQISRACRIMGIQFVDHLVLGKVYQEETPKLFPLSVYSIGLKKEMKTEVWL